MIISLRPKFRAWETAGHNCCPVRETVYFEYLKKLYATIQKVAIGQSAPAFSIPDVNGSRVGLEAFRDQYVLLDFWASWCAPCRRANPAWVELYQAYHGQKFTIVGISVDDKRDNWLRAIEKDQLPWTNLSNLKGWDEVADEYGVKAIPQNFLLAPEGVILAKNLEPTELKEMLSTLLLDD